MLSSSSHVDSSRACTAKAVHWDAPASCMLSLLVTFPPGRQRHAHCSYPVLSRSYGNILLPPALALQAHPSRHRGSALQPGLSSQTIPKWCKSRSESGQGQAYAEPSLLNLWSSRQRWVSGWVRTSRSRAMHLHICSEIQHHMLQGDV